MTDKRCGTCHYWVEDKQEPSGSYCAWPEPDLPFWATLNNGDHADYVQAEQGTTCRTWVPIVPSSRSE